ncbi:preprotein translocase subunit SecG, partial [Vibrio parahaemolyticus]
IQKSEGGGLGMGGGGGMSGLMTGRSTANLLTRVTAGLFAAFVLTSITLSVLAAHRHSTNSAVLDRLATPVKTVAPTPAAPAAPKAPSVPI